MSRPLKTKDELKEETKKVLEEEQEEFKNAAEKTAAKEEKEKETGRIVRGILEKPLGKAKFTDPEPVLFSEEDREKDEKSPLWYKEFEENLKEENEKEAEKYLNLDINKERENLESLKKEKKEKYPNGKTVEAVLRGIRAGKNGKVDVDFSDYNLLEEEIQKIKTNIEKAEYMQKEKEYKNILNSSQKREKAAIGYGNWQSFDAKKEKNERKKESEKEKADYIFSAMGSSPDATSASGWTKAATDVYRDDTSYKKPNEKWTKDQKSIFGYYWYKGDLKRAEEYAISVNNLISKGEKEKILDKFKDESTKNALNEWLYSAGTIAVSPFSGAVDYLDKLVEKGSRGVITEKSEPSLFELSQEIRDSIKNKLSEKYGKPAGILYETAMGGGDFILSAVLGGNSGVVISSFGNNASEAYYDAIERGAEQEQALGYATAVGTAEMIPDMISNGKLSVLKNAQNIGAFKKNIMDEIMTEMSGGVSSHMVSILADEFIMQNKSKFSSLVSDYQMLGYTEKKAKEKAYGNIREGIVLASITGLLDGTIKTLPKVANDAFEYNFYRNNLGKNAPPTIDNYWELKYNSGEWNKFKDYAYSVKNGELSAFADFELYKKIDKEIENSLVGTTANGGIRITGKSAHFTNQVIGSVFSRKSGVEISDIQKALQTKPIKIGNEWCFCLDRICIVSVDETNGKLKYVKPLY